MKIKHSLLLYRLWADACNCTLWFESQTHIFIPLPCLSEADSGPLLFHQLVILSQNLWAALLPHELNCTLGGIYVGGKTVTPLLKHWGYYWWQTLSVTRVWLSCFASDSRIFTDTTLESDFVFLSAHLFADGKWYLFNALFKFNSIITNNSDLWKKTLSQT